VTAANNATPPGWILICLRRAATIDPLPDLGLSVAAPLGPLISHDQRSERELDPPEESRAREQTRFEKIAELAERAGSRFSIGSGN
jgi:hypothetical protein